MKADPDCIPYALNQVLQCARLVTEDEWIHRKVLTRVLAELANDTDLESTAPEIMFACLQTAYKALGVSDPYENEKARINKAVKALENDFREYIGSGSERMENAVRLALASTIINASINDREMAGSWLKESLGALPPSEAIEDLALNCTKAENILYILNNAGEAVLDRLLIEELGKKSKVTVVTRPSPILNDITSSEAGDLGFADMPNVNVIDTGAPMLGVLLEKSSIELQEHFKSADIVICKGQANYETLCSSERDIFFLLYARSAAVAKRVGVEVNNSVIIKHMKSDSEKTASKSTRIKKVK